MKKVLIPKQKEESIYYSDFKGKCFGEIEPPITIKICFNYGSKNDGEEIEIHLTDEEFEPLLKLIENKLCEESKKIIKKIL
jgi:hypothetical protein